nr:hypothetical protein BaRGS_023591 [Batillaria attramentaria]
MLVMCDRPLAVRLLLAEGAEVDCRDGQDRTPLHLAAIYGNLRITDILMQNADCNVNALDGTASLTTPYHERPRPSADKYKARPATASARLSTRRVSSGQQRRGFSPRLSVASLHHGLSTLNSHNRRDSTVSFVLTPSNVGTVRCKMVSLLLDHGADANLMTQFRKSALHMAAMLGDANVMALLLPETTNPNMLSASNKTALHLAVEGGHTPNVSQLIHAGANLGLRDMEGMTPLHMAAKLGHADMVTMLLRAKADKNSSDFKQMTPLHHACKNGHTDVTDILLRAGCRTDLVDDQGVLALDYRDNCIAEKDEKEEPCGAVSISAEMDMCAEEKSTIPYHTT